MFSFFKPKPKLEQIPSTGACLYPVLKEFVTNKIDEVHHDEVVDLIAKYIHDQLYDEEWYHQITVKLSNDDENNWTKVQCRIVFILTKEHQVYWANHYEADIPEDRRAYPIDACVKTVKVVSKLEDLNYADDLHLIRKYGVEYKNKVNVLRMSFLADAVFELDPDTKVYLEDKNLTEMRDSVADAISKYLDPKSKLFEYFKQLVSPAIKIGMVGNKFQVDIIYPVDNPIYPYSEEFLTLLYRAIQSLKDSGLFIFDQSGVDLPIKSEILSFKDL